MYVIFDGQSVKPRTYLPCDVSKLPFSFYFFEEKLPILQLDFYTEYSLRENKNEGCFQELRWLVSHEIKSDKKSATSDEDIWFSHAFWPSVCILIIWWVQNAECKSACHSSRTSFTSYAANISMNEWMNEPNSVSFLTWDYRNSIQRVFVLSVSIYRQNIRCAENI